MSLLDAEQHRRELLFEPGMQDRVGHRQDAFGREQTRGWPKEREEFVRASPFILVGV